MKRCAIALVLVFLALGVTACRQFLPDNQYLRQRTGSVSQSTREARRAFRHDKHDAVFAEQHLTCIDCHHFDLKIDAKEALGRALSAHAMHPSSVACHTCHLAGEGKITAAPERCLSCHENMRPLLPEDHQVAWLQVHPSMARSNPARCENCHQQTYCIDCHERRDTVQTRMHDRNFRFTHSIEASADPSRCGSCHRPDYCTNCHQQGRLKGAP